MICSNFTNYYKNYEIWYYSFELNFKLTHMVFKILNELLPFEFSLKRSNGFENWTIFTHTPISRNSY